MDKLLLLCKSDSHFGSNSLNSISVFKDEKCKIGTACVGDHVKLYINKLVILSEHDLFVRETICVCAFVRDRMDVETKKAQ